MFLLLLAVESRHVCQSRRSHLEAFLSPYFDTSSFNQQNAGGGTFAQGKPMRQVLPLPGVGEGRDGASVRAAGSRERGTVVLLGKK